MEGWAVVVPESREQISTTARGLLAAAEHPRDVLTQRGGTEFLVPEAVADRYRKSLSRRGRAKKEASDG